MNHIYELSRMYVWYKEDEGWRAEGKWWRKDEYGVNVAIGTINPSYFQESLSDAIDEIVTISKEMNITITPKIWIEYHETYAYWESPDDKENPFPAPKNVDSIIEAEIKKRGWRK